MSNMEFFIGTYREHNDIDPDIVNDDDELYELEEDLGCHFIKIHDQVFSIWPKFNVDPHCFSLAVPPQDDDLLILYWYNGGAGVHEVAEATIKQRLAEKKDS